MSLLPDDRANGTRPPALGRGACQVNAAKRSGAPEGLGIEWHDTLERSGGNNLRGGVGMVTEKGRPPACEARVEHARPDGRKGVLPQIRNIFRVRRTKVRTGPAVFLHAGSLPRRQEICEGRRGGSEGTDG